MFINCLKHCHFNNLKFSFIRVKEKLSSFNYHLELTLFLFNQIQTAKDQIRLFEGKQLKK
jgi:hypothetical protein